MPLKLLNRASKKLGVRLTLWYSTIFILSSVILFIVSYVFLSTHIQDNREDVELKLKEYLSLAEEGGIPAVQKEIEEGREASPNTHFFVRILDSEHEVVFSSSPQLWERFDFDPSKTGPSRGNGSIFQPNTAATYWRLPSAISPTTISWKSARTSKTGKRFWNIFAIL